jgi:rubrerythrin
MPKLKKKSVAQKLRDEKQRTSHKKPANTAARRLVRQDEARRKQEQTANTESHRRARQDTVRRSTERRTFWDAEKKRRNSSKSNYEKLLERYINQIRESPSYICSCCGGLWYIKSTTCASKEKLIKSGCNTDLINTVLHVNQEQHRFCATCKKSVAEMRVPRLCLSNGFDFPVLSNDVKVLLNSRE